MATPRYVPVNGAKRCTCGKRVEIMGWRVGALYAFFCSEQHARQEEARVNTVRAKEGLAPIQESR
jgi:hypothetical protein